MIWSTIAVIDSTSMSYCVPASVSACAAAMLSVPGSAVLAIVRAIFDAAADCERAIFRCFATALVFPSRA